MADRTVDSSPAEVPEFPEVLRKVLIFSLEEAREKKEKGEDIVPFTALVVKENLFLESHQGSTSEQCYAYARHTVQGALGADAYAFCYDGYLDTDSGDKDAIIAEGGVPGESQGYAVAYLYTENEDGTFDFYPEAAYIGSAPNFMAGLRDPEDVRDEEIDERYLDAEPDDEPLEDTDPNDESLLEEMADEEVYDENNGDLFELGEEETEEEDR